VWRVSGEWFHAVPPILSYVEHSRLDLVGERVVHKTAWRPANPHGYVGVRIRMGLSRAPRQAELAWNGGSDLPRAPSAIKPWHAGGTQRVRLASYLRIEEPELEAGGDVVPARLTFPVKSGNL
jgi:hypothetical protein